MAIGDLVATLSVAGSSASFALSSNPGGFFSVAGSHLVEAINTPAGTYPITITAIGPGIAVTQSFSLNYAPGSIQSIIVLDNIPIGAAFAEITTDLSGTLVYSFTSNPGNLFSLAGNQIQVAGLLSVETYNIGVRVTNGTATETATLTVICTSVANSWIPGIRPWSPTSLCNTLLASGATYTPVAWPTSTGFNYFTGVKFYIDIPASNVTTVCSWLTTGDFGGAPLVTMNRVMTPGFSGSTLLSGVSDGDNEMVSFAETNCLNVYNFTRTSNTAAVSGPYAGSGAAGDIINGTGFAIPGGGQFGNNLAAGVVAAGSSLMMGCLLKEEFTLYGDFNHWIAFSMIHTLTQSGFIPPAIGGDGPGGAGTLFQTGQLLAIPKSTAMPGGLSIYGQAMFRAMQNYGAWPMDTGGSVTPYMGCLYDPTQGGASIPFAAVTSWTATEKGLLIADVNILFPLLQAVS